MGKGITVIGVKGYGMQRVLVFAGSGVYHRNECPTQASLCHMSPSTSTPQIRV
jgi:hypothetical protein